MYSVGIITLSDKGYAGLRVDESKMVIEEIVLKNGFKIVEYVLLPDDFQMIKETLIDFCDNKKISLVLTTGGTGFSKRDITPEATKEVIEREAPGICEAMRLNSLSITKRAMLSRSVAGIRGNSLIINLPGSKKAVRENLEYIIEDLIHGIQILLGDTSECARP